MNRLKKLILNCLIITFIFSCMYYFGGYYLSKEKCIEDTLKSCYAKPQDQLIEYKNNRCIVTLFENKENDTYSILETRKRGIFYEPGSSQVDSPKYKDEPFWISYQRGDGLGTVIYIYRNNPEIETIEMVLESGDQFVLSEWKEDFTSCLIEEEIDFKYGGTTCKAYDALGNLVHELDF